MSPSNADYSRRPIEGKKALVTGGGSGIGEAICRQLAAVGVHVIVSDIDIEAASRVAQELPNARSLHMDVSSLVAVEKAAKTVEHLDILVNNAGIGLVGGIAETAFADFTRIMNVNVNSVFLVTQSLLPKLLVAQGSIINIASVAALVGIKRRFAYSASKGAVLSMTRQLAVDYPTELRVNCICPGTVDSPFVAGYIAKYHDGEEAKVRAELNARQPVGRLGRPDEIASLVKYLCTPEADFMHGATLTMDGGWTAA